MPRFRYVLGSLFLALLAGCIGQTSSESAIGSAPGSQPEASESELGELAAVVLTNGQAELTPENTSIEFIGTHVGDRPDPRHGRFTQFRGAIAADAARQAVTSIKLDIQTASLTTQIDRLTGHLKSPDFFDVNQYPDASFAMTGIDSSAAGEYTMRGELTLHGVTKEISFPAHIEFGDDAIALKSTFTIDRTAFGMDWGQERVNKEVEVRVVVGKPTH